MGLLTFSNSKSAFLRISLGILPKGKVQKLGSWQIFTLQMSELFFLFQLHFQIYSKVFINPLPCQDGKWKGKPLRIDSMLGPWLLNMWSQHINHVSYLFSFKIQEEISCKAQVMVTTTEISGLLIFFPIRNWNQDPVDTKYVPSLFFFFSLIFRQGLSKLISQANPELATLLLLPSECWDYSCTLPHRPL
jgi:hypothetical protein